MDKIYASLDLRWVGPEFKSKTFLNEYKQNIGDIRGSTAIEAMSNISRRDITKEEAEELSKSCSVDKFNCPTEPLLKLPPQPSGDTCVSFPITEEGRSHLSTLRLLSSRGQYQEDKAVLLPKGKRMCTNLKRDTTQGLDAVAKEPNLKPMEHVLLTLKIYHPFEQKYGSRNRKGPILAQIIDLLGEVPLTSIRDIIFCVNDYAVPGDRSEKMDEEASVSNKELYPSGFFFIGDTFYNDTRNVLSKDYSQVIINWLQRLPNSFKVTSTPMEKAKVEDLNIRLGYPYVYVHQGSCEHLMVFSDARIINSSDSLCSMDYPLVSYLYKKYSILCNFCGHFVAIWILHSCDRVPYTMVHLCDLCLKMYCYKKKQKIGKFLLYEYIDPSSIAPETFGD